MTKSFTNCQLPENWKKVVQICKKGDRLSPSQYRPISLTSVVCKCIEKIVAWDLTSFLMEFHSALLPIQDGFLPGRSVSANLIKNLELWTRAQEEDYPVDVIYLDFEKAFDAVPFHRLIYKLEHFGVRGKLLSWIGEYVTGRSFQVRINGHLSESMDVVSGVPQGSVLGPLLFIIYVADIGQNMSCKSSPFADDTKIFCDPTFQHGDMAQDLYELKRWTDDWLLRLNVNKCAILHIGYNDPHLPYFIDGSKLAVTEEQINLGVTIASNPKWESHITKIVKRANSTQ